jgi:hypothetical protein
MRICKHFGDNLSQINNGLRDAAAAKSYQITFVYFTVRRVTRTEQLIRMAIFILHKRARAHLFIFLCASHSRIQCDINLICRLSSHWNFASYTQLFLFSHSQYNCTILNYDTQSEPKKYQSLICFYII